MTNELIVNEIINIEKLNGKNIVEIGPGKVLSSLIKRTAKNVKIDTINLESDIKDLKI